LNVAPLAQVPRLRLTWLRPAPFDAGS